MPRSRGGGLDTISYARVVNGWAEGPFQTLGPGALVRRPPEYQSGGRYYFFLVGVVSLNVPPGLVGGTRSPFEMATCAPPLLGVQMADLGVTLPGLRPFWHGQFLLSAPPADGRVKGRTGIVHGFSESVKLKTTRCCGLAA